MPTCAKASGRQGAVHIYSCDFPIAYPVNMPDPIRIRSWSARKYWPEAGWVTPAYWLASGQDPFGQNTISQN